MPPENDGAGAPQAGAPAQPQAGAAAGGQEPPAGNGQAAAAAGSNAGDGETPDERIARLERELSETRGEAARNRRKAADLEKAQQAAAQAGMTEAEREKARAEAAEAKAAELEGRLRAQAVEGATLSAATKLNFRNPELAHRLINPAELEYDDNGRPKNVEPLLRALAQAEPYLVKPAASDFGGGNRGGAPGGGQPTMNELVKAALGKG